MTGLHTALTELAAEHRAGANPAPYTSERALIERIEALLDEHPATRSERLLESEWNFGYVAGYNDSENGTICGRRRAASAHLPVATDSTTTSPGAPCIHCGRALSAHGEREACTKPGYYGNRYTPDLLAALQRSVDAAKTAHPLPASEPSDRAGLSEKWLRASEAARKAEHHFPADCLAEAVDVVTDLADLADRLGTAEAGLFGAQRANAILRDRLAVAEQERNGWKRSERAWHLDADRLAEVVATLRAQVAAVEVLADRADSEKNHHGATGYVFTSDLRAALGDSAPVVQRIRDEGIEEGDHG